MLRGLLHLLAFIMHNFILFHNKATKTSSVVKTSFLLFRLFLKLLKGVSFLFYKKLWCSISGGITISLFCELNNVSWPMHRDSKAVLWSIRL